MISIGIDVSKGKSKVCAVNHYGEVLISPHDVIHTKPSLDKLVQQIHALNDECKAVLEATGHYHYPTNPENLKVYIEKSANVETNIFEGRVI